MIRTLLIAAALVLPVAAAAQAHRSIFDEIDHCPGASNMEILQCAIDIGDREDARLNRAYKAAMARLPAPRQQALRVEQRRWIKDRDAQCKPEFDGGGAQAEIYGTACIAGMAHDRALELERTARTSHARP